MDRGVDREGQLVHPKVLDGGPHQLEASHDDVLDARRAALTDEQRTRVDVAFARTTEVLIKARRQAGVRT